MGLIGSMFGWLFGNGRNAIVEVAEVFKENSEASATRAAQLRTTVSQQFAAEFLNPNKSGFDRFMDGVNRVPRPALALGTLAMFGAAMFDPVWFADRMYGLSKVPEPLWWLLGAVVSFYFGARHQWKGQEFQKSLAATFVQAPQSPARSGLVTVLFRTKCSHIMRLSVRKSRGFCIPKLNGACADCKTH